MGPVEVSKSQVAIMLQCQVHKSRDTVVGAEHIRHPSRPGHLCGSWKMVRTNVARANVARCLCGAVLVFIMR